MPRYVLRRKYEKKNVFRASLQLAIKPQEAVDGKLLASKPNAAADCKLRLRVASAFCCPLQAKLASTCGTTFADQTYMSPVFVCRTVMYAAFGPMTVEIKQDYRISFDDGKFISLPDALIVEHNGEHFLKVKATSASIISIITGKVAPKNGSFATSKNLLELLRLRNEADGQNGASSRTEAPEDLFKNVSSEPPAKKVKVQVHVPDQQDHTVSIMVKDCNVVCLMMGIRPSKSDLTVKVDADMLSAVFEMLREDIHVAMDACRRSYTKKQC